MAVSLRFRPREGDRQKDALCADGEPPGRGDVTGERGIDDVHFVRWCAKDVRLDQRCIDDVHFWCIHDVGLYQWCLEWSAFVSGMS